MNRERRIPPFAEDVLAVLNEVVGDANDGLPKDAAHEKFVKLTRERGYLLTYPTVRRVRDDEHRDRNSAHKEVASHRRFETAQRANLDMTTARIADLDA